MLAAQVLMGGGFSLWVSSSKGPFTGLTRFSVFLWGHTPAGLCLIMLEFVFSLVVLQLFLELDFCLYLGCQLRAACGGWWGEWVGLGLVYVLAAMCVLCALYVMLLYYIRLGEGGVFLFISCHFTCGCLMLMLHKF